MATPERQMNVISLLAHIGLPFEVRLHIVSLLKEAETTLVCFRCGDRLVSMLPFAPFQAGVAVAWAARGSGLVTDVSGGAPCPLCPASRTFDVSDSEGMHLPSDCSSMVPLSTPHTLRLGSAKFVNRCVVMHQHQTHFFLSERKHLCARCYLTTRREPHRQRSVLYHWKALVG